MEMPELWSRRHKFLSRKENVILFLRVLSGRKEVGEDSEIGIPGPSFNQSVKRMWEEVPVPVECCVSRFQRKYCGSERNECTSPRLGSMSKDADHGLVDISRKACLSSINSGRMPLSMFVSHKRCVCHWLIVGVPHSLLIIYTCA